MAASFRARERAGALVIESESVVAAFTRRDGPVVGRLGGTNLSRRAGDIEDAVFAAREWAAGLIGLTEDRLVWGRQVHGAGVAYADEQLAARGPRAPALPDTDAFVTNVPRVGVGVLVADCTPTLIAGERALAVVHSGWRGLLAGVVERAAACLRRHDPGWPLTAFVGPSIGPCCYEVGEDVARRFRSRRWGIVADSGTGRPAHLDLRRGVASALADAGIEDVRPLFPCTCCVDSYFSHRRGDTGRQALIAALR